MDEVALALMVFYLAVNSGCELTYYERTGRRGEQMAPTSELSVGNIAWTVEKSTTICFDSGVCL